MPDQENMHAAVAAHEAGETKPGEGKAGEVKSGEVKPGEVKSGRKERQVVSCNFRSAGRLSNENARSLTAIHETFARYLATALDMYVGTAVEVRLKGIEQVPVREHVAALPPLSYIVPLSLSTTPATMILEWDINLVFPLIELLLGGSAGQNSGARELSEIEEEIMHEVAGLFAHQAESAWHMQSLSLTAGRRVKSSYLHQLCQPTEKLTLAMFEAELAGTTGTFHLIFPSHFLNILLQQIRADQPARNGSLRFFPKPSIRERLLESDVVIAAELPSLRVTVRDLVALQPGSVLKLRAPVRNPGMLTVGGQGLFEATPVRNGSQKAAQLGRRISSSTQERGQA